MATRKPAPIPVRSGTDTVERVDFLREQIRTLEQMLAKYRNEPKSSIAAMQAVRAIKDARDALDEELAKSPSDPWAGLSEDEIRHRLREEAADMPEQHLAVLVEVYCERVGVRFPLRAAAGGSR
jgi:hypothetical protein